MSLSGHPFEWHMPAHITQQDLNCIPYQSTFIQHCKIFAVAPSISHTQNFGQFTTYRNILPVKWTKSGACMAQAFSSSPTCFPKIWKFAQSPGLCQHQMTILYFCLIFAGEVIDSFSNSSCQNIITWASKKVPSHLNEIKVHLQSALVIRTLSVHN